MSRASHGFGIVAFAWIVQGAFAQQELARFDGTAAKEQLGDLVVGVGDVDGDGIADVATRGFRSNFVYVYSVATGRQLHCWSIRNGSWIDELSITGPGDLNADAHADVVVGDPTASSVAGYSGCVYAYSGATGSMLWSSIVGGLDDQLGYDVAAIGDIDGDGVPDVLASTIGYYYWAPYVAILSGKDGTEINRYTDTSGDYFVDVDGLGDVDGDLVDDFLACNLFGSEIDLVSGATCSKLGRIKKPAGAERWGEHACSIADLNGDGRRDILTGAYRYDAGPGNDETGAVYIHSSSNGAVILQITGSSDGGEFGTSIADAGDVDGDSISDFLAGAPNDPNGGYVDLYSGRTAALLVRLRGLPGDHFGRSVGGAGDANGDGLSDFAIGAPLSDAGGNATGSVRVHAGNDLFLQVDPPVAVANDVVTLIAAEGPTGALALIALVDVNGTPTFLVLGGIGVFDSTLRYSIAGTVPPGLAGNTLSFRAWGDDASGTLRSSEAATLSLQ